MSSVYRDFVLVSDAISLDYFLIQKRLFVNFTLSP